MAKRLADHLGLPWAIVNKMRREVQQSEVTHVIGDVRDKRVIMIDDLIDTAGTLCNAAEKLIEEGATEVYAAATRGILGSGLQADRSLTPQGGRRHRLVPLKEDEPRSKSHAYDRADTREHYKERLYGRIGERGLHGREPAFLARL